MQPSDFTNTFSFSVFRTPVTVKQTSYWIRAAWIVLKWVRTATWSSYFFAKSFFSECLVVCSSYVSLITTSWYQIFFLIRYILKIITCSAEELLSRSYFFRISNYSEEALFRNRYFIRTATFSEEELLQE